MKLHFQLITTICVAMVTGNIEFLDPKTREIIQSRIESVVNPTRINFSPRQAIISLFNQKVDHNNPMDIRTFIQRYFTFDDNYYQPGGPIYIYFGGISDFLVRPNSISMDGLLLDEIANNTNGVIYGVETRYFGQSIPTVDLTIENMKYLTIDQILADYASVIIHLRRTYEVFGTTTVIAVGFGSGGTLATWMRSKYPDLVDAVWSSSGPVYVQMDFDSYLPDISATIQQTGGIECDERIKLAFEQMEEIVEDGNTSKLEELFNWVIPIDLTSEQEIATFFHGITTIVTTWVSSTDISSIHEICEILMDEEIEDNLDAFSSMVQHITGGAPLMISYNLSVTIYSQIGADSLAATSGARAILYLMCTQLSWYQTAHGGPHPFSSRLTVDYYTLGCRDVFDDTFTNEQIDANNQQTNILYGGFTPTLTNGYLTNGELDPFRLLGLTEDLNINTPVDLIPYVGKNADIMENRDSDSAEVQAVKRRIFDMINSIMLPDK